MNRVSLRFTKKSNVARVAASSSHLWPERRPKRSSDALRRRDVRFLSIDPAHARFRSLFLHRVNDKRVPAPVSRSHRASPSPSRAHVARARPFVRPPRARIPRRLVRRPRTLMMMNGRPNSSNAKLIFRRRRARWRRRSVRSSAPARCGLVRHCYLFYGFYEYQYILPRV